RQMGLGVEVPPRAYALAERDLARRRDHRRVVGRERDRRREERPPELLGGARGLAAEQAVGGNAARQDQAGRTALLRGPAQAPHAGSRTAPAWARNGAWRWPAMWCTGTSGLPWT